MESMDRAVYMTATVTTTRHVTPQMDAVTVRMAIMGSHVNSVRFWSVFGFWKIYPSYDISFFLACPEGLYGKDCAQNCHCLNGPSFDSISGQCRCKKGYIGGRCEKGWTLQCVNKLCSNWHFTMFRMFPWQIWYSVQAWVWLWQFYVQQRDWSM